MCNCVLENANTRLYNSKSKLRQWCSSELHAVMTLSAFPLIQPKDSVTKGLCSSKQRVDTHRVFFAFCAYLESQNPCPQIPEPASVSSQDQSRA